MLTGAEGSIHPSPVPVEPGMEKTLSADDEKKEEEDCFLVEAVLEKLEACWWMARKKPTAMEESFMVVFVECSAFRPDRRNKPKQNTTYVERGRRWAGCMPPLT